MQKKQALMNMNQMSKNLVTVKMRSAVHPVKDVSGSGTVRIESHSTHLGRISNAPRNDTNPPSTHTIETTAWASPVR